MSLLMTETNWNNLLVGRIYGEFRISSQAYIERGSRENYKKFSFHEATSNDSDENRNRKSQLELWEDLQ